MANNTPPDIHFHRLANGRQLAWRQIGQGPPLVMLHGWSMSGAVFHEVATALSSDFQVFCPDLCGHGWSDPADHYSLSLFADDISDWIDTLELPRPALLGWSLGGQVVMHLAKHARSRVSRLLLISTTPCFCQKEGWLHGLPQTQVRTMDRQLKRAYLKTLGDFFDLQFAEEQLSAARRKELLDFAVRASRLPEAEDCMATLDILATEDIRALLSGIDCPVMVMHGTRDQIIPGDAGRYLATEISEAQLHLLDGVGHAPFMSRPGECVEIWQGFLK